MVLFYLTWYLLPVRRDGVKRLLVGQDWVGMAVATRQNIILVCSVSQRKVAWGLRKSFVKILAAKGFFWRKVTFHDEKQWTGQWNGATRTLLDKKHFIWPVCLAFRCMWAGFLHELNWSKRKTDRFTIRKEMRWSLTYQGELSWFAFLYCCR